MSLKENINKLHYKLSELFGDVKIEEKESRDLGKYFQISAFNENKQIKIKVSFKDLESSKFKWVYSENPLNENAQWIERISDIDNIENHISDIFNKNRFSEDYLDLIKK